MLATIFNKVLSKIATNFIEIFQRFILVRLTEENSNKRDLKI
jgi:hypothetical protein